MKNWFNNNFGVVVTIIIFTVANLAAGFTWKATVDGKVGNNKTEISKIEKRVEVLERENEEITRKLNTLVVNLKIYMEQNGYKFQDVSGK